MKGEAMSDMMMTMGLVGLLVVAFLILAITALANYLFGG